MSCLDLDNPELYVELLHHSSRDPVAKTKSCPEPALEMDDLRKRVRTFVDVLANGITKYPWNPVAARTQIEKEELHVHIYYTFNDTTSDEYILSNTSAHLSYLLDELRSAALPVIQESPPPYKIDYRLLQTLSWRVHRFCLDTFIHRVQKSQKKFYLPATVDRLYEMRGDLDIAMGGKCVKRLSAHVLSARGSGKTRAARVPHPTSVRKGDLSRRDAPLPRDSRLVPTSLTGYWKGDVNRTSPIPTSSN
ncbi:hypothetical protein E1B28_013503 [Marasmius oreades]|uniref:Uncharacterized protein n=1 Tax=Marasmius oreades TaxID=181124 RepID=A0A9P7RQB1_9AGAR|nr:uncharacterized protein E1B28_013503 [Marasmius oreades]KAG7087547.1 hypothetical protein E1B28_013503 [Marasmius oreades]